MRILPPKTATLLTTNQDTGFDIAFGISSYAFAWAIGMPGNIPAKPMTVTELLRSAHQVGAACLQIADNLPVHQLPAESWQRLLTMSRQFNIQLELGLRGLKFDLVMQYLSLAKQCQSSFLRVVIDDADYEPGHEEIVQLLKALLPRLRADQIILAIENHDRFLSKEIKAFVESTDPDWVGVCLDTANSLGADEGIYEVTSTLAPYTVNLHVKDYTIKRLPHNMGFTVEGAPAGQGQTPIPWLLQQLKPHKKCHSATLEVWSNPLNSLEETIARERKWVEEGAKYLKTYLSLP